MVIGHRLHTIIIDLMNTISILPLGSIMVSTNYSILQSRLEHHCMMKKVQKL